MSTRRIRSCRIGPHQRTDTAKAHPARVYDVFLGVEDDCPADCEAAATANAVHVVVALRP